MATDSNQHSVQEAFDSIAAALAAGEASYLKAGLAQDFSLFNKAHAMLAGLEEQVEAAREAERQALVVHASEKQAKHNTEAELRSLREQYVALEERLGREQRAADAESEELSLQINRLKEQLEADNEAFRLIAQRCGEDGTEPDDWRAMTFPGPREFALMAVGKLRSDYDEAIGSNPATSP